LRNTIAWSYHLLPAQEQRLFRQLSVFVGGCTLEAIEAVCMTLDGEAESVLDAVASLIDKSLLQQTEQEGGEPRLGMLETLQETRESIEMALRLAAAQWWFWLTKGHRQEGWTFLERALTASEGLAVPARARAQWAAGNLAAWLGHFARAEALCQESLMLAEQIADAEGMRNAVFHLGRVADARGDFAAARLHFERSIVLSRETGDRFLHGHALEFLALEALYQGEYARTRLLIEEALAAFKGLGHKTGMMASLRDLACVTFFQGDLARAQTLIEECLSVQREIGSKHGKAGLLAFLANVTLYQGDILTARLLLGKSEALLRETRDEA
jgi:tetratricopeptide (TPR) repeat protein